MEYNESSKVLSEAIQDQVAVVLDKPFEEVTNLDLSNTLFKQLEQLV